MELSAQSVDLALDAILIDQQANLGDHVNSLIKAVRNQPPLIKRVALLCVLACLVHIHPKMPVRRWYPWLPEPEKQHRLFSALYGPALKYMQHRLDARGFLEIANEWWRMI